MAYNLDTLFEKYLEKRKAGVEFEQITNELTILGISDNDQSDIVRRIKIEIGKVSKIERKKNGITSVILGSLIFTISLMCTRIFKNEPYMANLFLGLMLVGTVFIVNGFRNR